MSRQQQYLIYQNFPPPIDINSKCVFVSRKGRKSVDGIMNQIFEPKISRISDNDLNLPCMAMKNVSENGRLSPCLPPCLLENERMHFVQQWINGLQDESLLRDMTLECEAVQSSSSGTENNSVLTYNHHQQTPVCGGSGLYEFIDRVPAGTSNIVKPWQQCRVQHGNVISVSSRFTADEVQMIAKLYEDYLRRGICPSLGEVRARMADTAISSRRTPQAVRAKIKRLQSHYQVNGLSFIN